jgi:glycosyltransferase involved in cell wall biosynthesis
MRIAQVAPLIESVPPRLYGGTERVVSYLTEELVRMGHEVVLYASGDSQTKAELRPVCPRSLRLQEGAKDKLAHHVLMLEHVMRDADSFDIIHYHIDYLHYPLSRRMRTKHVTTLHGRLDLNDLPPLYYEFRDMPVVSISKAQREPLPWAEWVGNVYHGLPDDLYRFNPEPHGYFAFLGRISPSKRADFAIEIARRAGREIRIAAKVDEVDTAYFDQNIRPLLDLPDVEFVGEIGEREKGEFLGNAEALLFPVDWPEPFGLVMIEALACGTPVIAFRRGSVPEILAHGETGFICAALDEAAEAARQIGKISRARCREVFEERFSAGRMAGDYVCVYEHLTGAREGAGRS